MSLLRLAVSLLVLDTLTTAWLLVRRRRRRRVVRVVPVPTIGGKDPTLALHLANQDLMRRQALLRTPDALTARVLGSPAELRLAADRLAAVDELVYDPTLWERRRA